MQLEDANETESRRLSVLDFAHGVLEMQQEIYLLRRELYRLRDIEEKYNSLLNESVAYSQQMMFNTLALCLTPGVVDAMTAAANKGDSA